MTGRKMIQARELSDINGDEYYIYDYMEEQEPGWWLSKAMYFDLDEVKRTHPGVPIEYKK